MRSKTLSVKKLSPEATLPTRAYPWDAGADIYSSVDMFIPHGKTVIVPTGVAVKVQRGFVGKIEDRSGLASKGLRTGGGVVDAEYSGEIGVVIHNLTSRIDKDPVLMQDGYRIRKGDKIAQILIYEVGTPQIVEVTELWTSDRGSKGFNSSGR